MCTVSMRKGRRKNARKQAGGQKAFGVRNKVAPQAPPARGWATTEVTLQLASGVRVGFISLICTYIFG